MTQNPYDFPTYFLSAPADPQADTVQRENEALRGQLTNIHGSRLWRIAGVYWRLLNRLTHRKARP